MQYARFFAGALMSTAAAFASAAVSPGNFTINLTDTQDFGNAFKGPRLTGQSFFDIYNFSISSRSDLDSALSSFATRSTYDLNITSFDLYKDSALVARGQRESTGALDVWTVSGLGISKGDYSLRVGGTILGSSGGSYGGNANVVPVPEPEAWSMVGLGLAVAGVMSRRRRSARPSSARAA
jgi:hypothetical protein